MREFTPTRDESRALATDHALIPVYREVLADMLTPVRAYTLLCPPGTPGFLLESVEGGERQARYSFVGHQPRVLDLGDGDPLPALRAVAAEATAPVAASPAFTAGRSATWVTRPRGTSRSCRWPKGAPPPMPESAFLRAEDLAVFDHVTRRLKLLTIFRPDREDYEAATARIDAMEERLASDQVAAWPRGVDGSPWKSNVTPGTVPRDGRRGQGVHPRRRHLPGRPLAAVSEAARRHPFDVYRALRAVNPSPYMFYLALRRGARSSAPRPRCWCGSRTARVETRPHRRHAPPRRRRRGGRAAGAELLRRREGARRARHAGRPRPQRRRPRVRDTARLRVDAS